MGKNLEVMALGSRDFLNKTPMAQIIILRIDKWDLIKLKNFHKAKDIVNKTNNQPTDWERIFTNLTSDIQNI